MRLRTWTLCLLAGCGGVAPERGDLWVFNDQGVSNTSVVTSSVPTPWTCYENTPLIPNFDSKLDGSMTFTVCTAPTTASAGRTITPIQIRGSSTNFSTSYCLIPAKATSTDMGRPLMPSGATSTGASQAIYMCQSMTKGTVDVELAITNDDFNALYVLTEDQLKAFFGCLTQAMVNGAYQECPNHAYARFR